MNGRYLRETDFPAVRRVMGPERNRLDDDAVEGLLSELFPDADPEDVEDFMGSMQAFGRQAAPVAQRALPGAMQGATQGAAIGGPWGALIGAAGGAAGSLLQGKAPGASAPAPVSLPTAPPAPPVPPGAATNPSAQLLALLSRPETMQALLALMLAGSGRSTVQVGEKAVPAAAFADAIAESAALVAEAAAPLDESVSGYLFDAEGEPRGDIANPGARAAVLLGDLCSVADAEALDGEEDEAYDHPSTTIYEGGGTQDPIDSYEAALREGAADEY
jgi:hypothetical protein